MNNGMRYIGVGGFLGSGKTTTLKRLALHYKEQGFKVGIVTNDQADNLVDTENLIGDGNDVEEVAGGCFCCKFNDLVAAIQSLRENNHADIVLAEPVGSCTDVVATVISPLLDKWKDKVQVSPHTVLVDPVRAKQILMDYNCDFSGKVIYIFRKQLEEADIILVNKIDTISLSERQILLDSLASEFPEKRVLAASALTGEGLDEWYNLLEAEFEVGQNIVGVNYEVYAEGEAQLGWLNASVELSSDKLFDSNDFALSLSNMLSRKFQEIKSEPAHLKMAVSGQSGFCIVNLVDNIGGPILSKVAIDLIKQGKLVINARVEIDPEILKTIVFTCLKDLCSHLKIQYTVTKTESFRPGRPNPTFRYNAPVSAKG